MEQYSTDGRGKEAAGTNQGLATHGGHATFYHLTIDTGHGVPSPRWAVSADIIRRMSATINTGLVRCGGFRFVVTSIPGGWRFSIGQDGQNLAPLVTCHLAAPDGGDAVWCTLLRDRAHLNLQPPVSDRPQQEPWLAVNFLPAMRAAQPAVVTALAGAERRMAWALLERGTPGALDAAPTDSDEPRPTACEMPSITAALTQRVREQGFKSIAAFVDAAAPRLTGTLASALARLADESSDPDLRQAADMIRRAGRFELDADVAEAVHDLRTDASDLLCHVDQIAKLPRDPCWIEYRLRDVAAGAGLDREGQAYLPERIGYLAFRDDVGRLCIRAASHFLGETILYPCVAAVRSGSVNVLRTWTDAPSCDREALVQQMFHHTGVVLRLLAMLSTRNTPLTFGPEPDYSRLNRQRQKSGKPPILGVRPIRLDLSHRPNPAGLLDRECTYDTALIPRLVQFRAKQVHGRRICWRRA